MNFESKNKFASFHIRQALGLSILFIALGLVISNFGSPMITFSMWIFMSVLWSYGMITAIKGQMISVPLIGNLFQTIFKNSPQHRCQKLFPEASDDVSCAETDEDLLEAIGRKRGALQGGKRVNLQKAAEIAIYDFRAAAMGRISLETPAEFVAWLAQGQKIDAERQIKKDAIELDRKIRFKKIPRPDSHSAS